MKELNQDIKDSRFRPVYLLYGEEAFLRNSYKKKLVEAIAGEDTMNYNCFDGKTVQVTELISLADTLPFFAPYRLIVIEDSGWFKGGPEELIRYLPSMPDTTHLVFVESEVDKRSRMYKKVKELGYAAELGRQDTETLKRWAASILTREGRKIRSSTMDFFLSRTGDDMENISMELEKLISYTMGQDEITEEDVETMGSVRVTNKIFDMIAALSVQNTAKAMDLYDDLLTLKEAPMRILFLIARQFNQLLQIKEMEALKIDRKTMAASMKLQPFILNRMIPQTKVWNREQLLRYVETCVQTEQDVKRGKLQDRVAVELLLAGAGQRV